MWALVILAWVFIIFSMFWVIPVVPFESEFKINGFMGFVYIITFIGTIGYLYALYYYCNKGVLNTKKEV